MEQIKKGNALTFRMADGNVIQLEQHDTLPSTLALAREYARSGYPDKYVIFTEKEEIPATEGDKRSKPRTESGIFMSCILRPSFFFSQSGFLGVLTGVSMLDALSAHTDRHLGLGWGSDLYCEGRKIAGASFDGKLVNYSAYEYLIVTFRILLDDESFPPRMGDIVRRVFEGDSSSLALLIGKNVLSRFFSLYPYLKTPEKFMDAYQRRFLLRGIRTKLVTEKKNIPCRILGVNPQNAKLIVERRGGQVLDISSPSQIIIPEKIHIKKK